MVSIDLTTVMTGIYSRVFIYKYLELRISGLGCRIRELNSIFEVLNGPERGGKYTEQW